MSEAISKKSKDITSYDFLKMAALFIMIIDHVGYYFFPEQMVFRAVGRACVPVWFFLIGYARSRDFSAPLWVGGAILVIANMIAGMHVFPLNILPAMLLVRFVIDPVMRFALIDAEKLLVTCVALIFLIIPTYAFTEYGTEGLLLAMAGYFARWGRSPEKPPKMERQDKPELLNRITANIYMVFAAIMFIAVEKLIFKFPGTYFTILAVGAILSFSVLYVFKPASYPGLTKKLPTPVSEIIKFCGRQTMWLYVIHLLIFKIASIAMFPERYTPFHWSWIS